MLGRQFMAFTIFDRTGRRSFHLLVDLDDGSVVDDVAAIEKAEVKARRAKYGKLHPLLYERLQTVSAEETLPVAAWIGGEYGHTRREVYAAIADRYVQVRDALARHASPFDVGNPALSRQVRAEYEQMRQEDIVARIQPMVEYLESRDVTFEMHYMLPSVTTALSKEEILALAEHDDVHTIYLVEGKEEPLLDTAVPTNRVAPVWQAGIDGSEGGGSDGNSPITIAIVEAHNVDWDNGFLHHATVRLVSPNGESDHTTRVASDAASFHGTYRGMAHGATILSAGENGTMPNIHFALNWALDQGAEVINYSAGVYDNIPDLGWLDRAFDHTARERGSIIVTAAGNRRDEYISTPAKGWNVITVGGINDQGNASWSDDVMYHLPGTNEGSSYLDPGSPYHDREKPEVVAPAQDITAIGLNDVPRTRSGTSHAAPQVAGLGALMMHRNPDVKGYPTAVKAILMASATHNVEGDSRLSDEDGAGSINATLADSIVQNHQGDGVTCWGSCWWAVETSSTYPDPDDFLDQFFYASQGDWIRVAIAWWSEADPPPPYPTLGNDALTTNFDLYVRSPSGELPGYSASWDNNFEIVEFVAPETGVYTIGTFKNPDTMTEDDNQLGIVLLRIPMPYRVYLPATMKNYP